jgi:pilus assembly protein CpaC
MVSIVRSKERGVQGKKLPLVGACLMTLLLAVFFPFRVTVPAAEYGSPPTLEAERLHLVSGKSILVKSAESVKRVSVANPEVADFTLISPQEIYVLGKGPGVTTLTLWQDRKVLAIYDLEVAYDTSRLKEKLHQVLPEEGDIHVLATHDSVTLSGRVSNTSNLSQTLALAKAYAPKGQVNNLLEVGGVHQVMLEVRVAEMQRSTIKRLGFNFTYLRGGTEFGVTTLGSLTTIVKPTDANIDSGGPFGLFVSPAVNALFRFNKGKSTWTGFIDALKEDGLAKVLAEPTLIAQSGQNASFLAGGQYPVPVPQGLGTVGIEYKDFGVKLLFTPTVLSENKICVKVAPEVSELDFTTALVVQGFVVPGLTIRKAETVIELADGQSFAIAGLLRENVRDIVDKYPLLGDIPILGALFRSRAFQKNETELVIIATPHLARPIDTAAQTLPTDYYIEPNDAELYLLGVMEGKSKGGIPTTQGKFDGQFGHAMPQAN